MIFFGAAFFHGGFFGGLRTGGKGDRKILHLPIKPTGLPWSTKKAKGRKGVEQRVDESRQIQAEVYGQLAKELRAEREKPVIQEMSLREIEAEIGELLRKKLRTKEEEILLLLLMVSAL